MFGEPRDQAILFVHKTGHDRDQVMTLLADFLKVGHDSDHLNEFQACCLIEKRGGSKTGTEVRAAVKKAVHTSSTNKISFLELCCAIYETPICDFIFTDSKTREAALEEAKKAAGEAEQALVRLKEIQAREETERRKREEESRIEFSYSAGVAEKAAFFKRRMVVDETALNQKKVAQNSYRVIIPTMTKCSRSRKRQPFAVPSKRLSRKS